MIPPFNSPLVKGGEKQKKPANINCSVLNGLGKIPLKKGDVTTRRAAPVAAGVTGGSKAY